MIRTSDGVLDLNTGVDFNEVVAAHLVYQELGCSSIPVANALRKLDSIGQDGLAHFLREVSGRSDLNDLLVATLNRAVTLEEMDSVSLSIS